MLKRSAIFLCVAAVAAGSVLAGDSPSKRTRRNQEKVKISVTPIGPSESVMEAAKLRLLQSPAVQSELSGKKFFLISFEYVENGTPDPVEFRAVIHDHSGDRTLVATGDFAGKRQITI